MHAVISSTAHLCDSFDPNNADFPLLANIQTRAKTMCQIFTLFTLNYLRLESEPRNFLYTVTNSYIMQF